MRIATHGVCGEIDTLPGNSQICVFHAVTNFGSRGKGNGKAAHRDRLAYAKRLGYQLALCTTDAANTAQIKILLTFGWLQVHEMKSIRTANTVITWKKVL